MKTLLTAGIVVLIVTMPTYAVAQSTEATDCWVETAVMDLAPFEVTVCLLEGGSIQIYASSSERPRMIDINLGYDAAGTECWWRTAYDTPWVILGVDAENVALVGYRPPGAADTALDAYIPACTSRPREIDNTLAVAWELANRYVHEIPAPRFNPDVGITGLETYLEVVVPDPVTASLVSPLGTTVVAEIKVAQVLVEWGDGGFDNYTETTFARLTGYPDGLARHIYETKTCPTPGGPRCHPSLAEYEIQVDFDWFVRWRVDTGPWSTIAVPNTTALSGYDVDEIITRTVPNP
ncbi:MAG: hypothetical protein OEP52_08515 [Acidimicrobiia bacterium]|nr:hypothetical protein [Acidimicrobiia bacterium]